MGMFRTYGLMLACCVLLFLAPRQGSSQVVIQTSVSQITLCPGDTATAVVQVSNFVNVATISLTLKFNPARLQYIDYTNAHPSLGGGMFFVNNTGQNIKIAWFALGPVNFDTGSIVSLRFRHLSGHGALQWDTLNPGSCQYSNINGVFLPAQFHDGYASAPGSVTVHPVNDTITTLDTASFSIETHGTTLTYRWQENAGSGWVDVFNGFFYSGAGTSQLRIIKPALGFSGRQYRCRTTGTCPAPGHADTSQAATLTVLTPCQPAQVNAGVDTLICDTDSLQLSATALHYQAISWTGGDGQFSAPASLSGYYKPGPGDILNGGVMLKVTATATPPCAPATDSLYLGIQSCYINQPPFFNLNGVPIDTLNISAYYQTTTQVCVALNDPENDTVRLQQILQYPIHGQIQGFFDNDLCFTYTPGPFYLGPDHLIIQGCDAQGLCDTLVVRLGVILPPNNLPPVAVLNGFVRDTLHMLLPVNNGGPVCVIAFDPEGDACDLTSIMHAPVHGQISGLGDGDTCAYYTPDTLFLGQDTCRLLLCDTAGGCTALTFIIQVADFQFPTPPQAFADFYSLPESTSLLCAVLDNDIDINGDIDTTSLEIVIPPMNGQAQVDTITGRILYVPLSYYYGTDYFVYRICDSSGYCDTAQVMLSIQAVFDPPQADHYLAFEDQGRVCTVLDNDHYPYQVLDTAMLSIWTAPKHGQAIADTLGGLIVYTPDPDYAGPDTFYYRICDTLQMCGIGRVSLDIQPVNDAPRLVRIDGMPLPGGIPVLTGCMDEPLIFCLGLMDPEGDTAYLAGHWAVKPGATTQSMPTGDTCLIYQPPAGLGGTDTIYCILSDGFDDDTIMILIQLQEKAYVYAGPAVQTCSGHPYITFQSAATAVSQVQWQTRGSGVFMDPAALHTTYIPSNQDILNQGVWLILTGQGLSPCGAAIDSLHMQFLPLPTTWLGSDTTLCRNMWLTLDAGPGFQQYRWSTGHSGRYLYVDTNLVGIGTHPITVTVTDISGCSNEDEILITFISCPGIEESPGSRLPQIYPNPSSGQLYILMPSIPINDFISDIYNLQGRLLQHYLTSAGNNPVLLDISHLHPGVYILRFFTGGRWHSHRIILR